MKKKRQRKIRNQILRGMSTAVLLTAVIFAAIAIAGLYIVQKEIVKGNASIIDDIVNAGLEKRIENISIQMEEQCKNLSLHCSEKMQSHVNELHICTGIIRDIYENPDNYGSNSLNVVSEDMRDRLCMYYRISNEIAYEDYKEFIGKTGSCSAAFEKIYENSSLNAIYYTSKEGVFFTFDKNSGEILDNLQEGQSPLYLNDYEPRETEWYKNSEMDDMGSVKFSRTYIDAINQRLVVTCSEPVYKGNEFMGVMAVDIYIDNLEKELIGFDKIRNGGIVEIADNSGNVIVSPNIYRTWVEKKQLNILEDNEEGLTGIAKDMVAGKSAAVDLQYNGEDSRAVYMPIEFGDAGWSIAIIFSTQDIRDEISRSGGEIIKANRRTEQKVSDTVKKIILYCIAGAMAAIIAGTLLGNLISRKITKPVESLIGDVKIISEGELDYTVNLETGDELQKLGEAFNKMTASLKEHIQNLNNITADRERIATELNVASNIQLGLLPDSEGEQGDINNVDIYAYIKPAREVGGDFYDYFTTDQEHIWVVMADVSGKGIPAALFMMLGKTIIKNLTQNTDKPSKILSLVNGELNKNNKEQMFITCFLGVLDLGSGEFTYANAGHNFPFFYKSGGRFQRLETTPEIPLAIMEGLEYEDYTLQLQEGDRLFLYTDGVTEAMNHEGELYGEDRLNNGLNSVNKENNTSRELVREVKKNLSEFVGGAEQADDITMLAFACKLPGENKDSDNQTENKYSVKVKGDLRELNRVLNFVEETLEREGFDRNFITSVKFIADELFSNIANYAYENENMGAEISIKSNRDKGVELTFIDWGKPYNPLEQPQPDVTLAPEERQEGGLGIYLVKSMADRMEYEYSKDRNIIIVTICN